MRFRHNVVLAAAAMLWLAAPARADELEDRVIALLEAGADTPVPKARYLALGEEAETALIACYQNTALPRYVRLRALSVLGAFPGERSRNFFLSLLESYRKQRGRGANDLLHPSRSSLVVRRALRALIAQHAQVSFEHARACIGHADAKVRRTAVLLIANSPEARVRQLLLDQKTRDPSALVRRSIDRALRDRSAQP